MTTAKKLMTAEEFAQLPDDDGRRLELIRGEVVELAPGNLEHGHIGIRFGGLLDAYNIAQNLGGYVSGLDPGIFLERDPDTVRAPDVCFYMSERVPPPEARRKGWAEVIPDLVVEVVSPGDTARYVEEKVAQWLAAGVRLVLVLYPSTQTVAAYSGRNAVRRFTADDTLDAAPVLPDFTCPVARLFE